MMTSLLGHLLFKQCWVSIIDLPGEICGDYDETTKQLDDGLGLCAKAEYELAISALGACTWCLSRAHKEYNILSLAKFKVQTRSLILGLDQ